ncbi:hypothetical protein [Endozoicomonas ascidiicola]|uniref:hypothetical protein n=1 Tax=Endozoicomonas ascidiicola TaxID=1698521 RepID=UPI00082D8BD3|nr:hypothetical protein [Endozoicomonas ascidiicola]
MFGGILLVLGFLVFLFAGLAKLKGKEVANVKPEESKKMMVLGAILIVVGLWSSSGDDGPSMGSAVIDVMSVIPDSKSSVHNYISGDLNEGVAVVINETAGYWVKDGVVYAANGIAKNMAPGVDYAPVEITQAKVEAAVK